MQDYNKIIQGDCVEMMWDLPDDTIDLTCTSPPYNNLRNYKGYVFNFKATVQQLFRVTKPGGVVVWVVADQTVKGGKTGTSFRQALYFQEIGFRMYDVLIYQKTGTSFPSNKRYTNVTEYMFVFSKGKPKTVNIIKDVPKLWKGSFGATTQRQKDGSLKKSVAKNCGAGKSGRAKGTEYGFKARSNIWTIVNGYGFAHPDPDLAKQHPATFPLALARDHIISWTNPGDLVLDPLNGGGTTCMAAKGLNRKYIGIDVSQEYCDLAEERLARVSVGGYLD